MWSVQSVVRHTNCRIQRDSELFELCEHGAQVNVRLGEVEEDTEDGLSGTRIVDHLPPPPPHHTHPHHVS